MTKSALENEAKQDSTTDKKKGSSKGAFHMVMMICYQLRKLILALPVMYFGGVTVPVDNLPHWAQNVSKFIYVRWYADAIRKIMINGVSAVHILKEFAMISLYTILALAVTLYLLKKDKWLH